MFLYNITRDNIYTVGYYLVIAPSGSVDHQSQSRVQCAHQDDSISWLRNLLTALCGTVAGLSEVRITLDLELSAWIDDALYMLPSLP